VTAPREAVGVTTTENNCKDLAADSEMKFQFNGILFGTFMAKIQQSRMAAFFIVGILTLVKNLNRT
jgi:hypothetical protein